MELLQASTAEELRILGTVALSLILGGLIGFEREEAQKPAGLRTHMLVAGAAALTVGLGEVIIEHFNREIYGGAVRSDPVRVIEAVITGVSFLGAGTILRRRGEAAVEGLTTAASILFTAGIGVAVALAQYLLAIGATILALITLRLINIFEARIINTDDQ